MLHRWCARSDPDAIVCVSFELLGPHLAITVYDTT